MILPTVARADCTRYQLQIADLWAEADLLTAVMAGCGTYGWRRQHQLPALTSRGRHHTAYAGDGGWPDVVAVRDSVLLVVELKREREYPTREQRAWLDLLATVPGVLAGVWRPRDWQHGVALDVLDNPTRYLEAA
jgi:hypothetical protein